MTPSGVQVSGRRPHNGDRIRPVQASESVPVKWAQATGMSGWASLAHLGNHLGNQAQVSLTFFFMPAIRAQGQSSSAPQKAVGIKVSICGPTRLRNHSPPSPWGSQQTASQRCYLTAHWQAASGKRREEETRTGLGGPGFPDPGGLATGRGGGGRVRLTGEPRYPGSRGGA